MSTLLIPKRTSLGTFLRQTSFSLLKERKRSSYFIYETQGEGAGTASEAALDADFLGDLFYVQKYYFVQWPFLE